LGNTDSRSGTAREEGAVDPKIVDMPRMVLVGVVNGAPDVSKLDEGGMGIAEMWERFGASSSQVANAVEDVFYEYHVERQEEPRMHFCLVGVQVTEIGTMPPDMFVKVLPEGTYAVFTHRVCDGYGKLYEEINAWLGASEYEEAAPFDFQLYDSRFKSMDDPESVQDIYIPVRAK
jgi:AraC family transcriptional regulator